MDNIDNTQILEKTENDDKVIGINKKETVIDKTAKN